MKSDGRGSYTVTEVLSPQEITSRIDGTGKMKQSVQILLSCPTTECQSLFAEGGPVSIEECFHVFYSVMQ